MSTRTTIKKKEKDILYEIASLLDDVSMADKYPEFCYDCKIDKTKNIELAINLSEKWSEM